MTAPLSIPPTLGSVRADEILPAKILCRRLGIGRHTLSRLRRMGLREIHFGRGYYFRGADVVAIFDRLAREQAEEGAGVEGGGR